MGPGAVLVALAVLGMPGCGDDDGPAASSASTTSSTDASAPASTARNGDGEGPCGGGPQDARVRRSGDQWVLDAEIEGRPVELVLAIEDRTAEPRVLGRHDVDGDGAGEVFVELGRGAAAAVVGLVTVAGDCELAPVLGPDGFLAQLPVGASAATQRGVACRDDRLVELSGETTDGRTFRWTSRTLELVDTAFTVAETDEGTYTSPQDDEEIRRLGALDCGPVTL
jgi:hypothetical protein